MESANCIISVGIVYRYRDFLLIGFCRDWIALGYLGGGRFLCKTPDDCLVVIPFQGDREFLPTASQKRILSFFGIWLGEAG